MGKCNCQHPENKKNINEKCCSEQKEECHGNNKKHPCKNDKNK